MHPFTAINEFATNDPVAAGILVAVIGGVFAIVGTVINSGTTIIAAYIQSKEHKKHEDVSDSSNAIVMDIQKILRNGTYIHDEKTGGKVWPKGK